MALNPRQAKFVAELVKGASATQAAVAAGYSAKNAESIGSRLSRNVKVREAVEAGQSKVIDAAGLTAKLVLTELMRLALVDLTQALNPDGTLKPLHEMPEDVRRCIASFEQEEFFEGAEGERFSLGKVKKLKFWDKPKALELLGKSLKLFTDKVEHSGSLTLEQLVAAASEKK